MDSLSADLEKQEFSQATAAATASLVLAPTKIDHQLY